jgi:PERQ amino acid-rich with GYF domain-containing protein
VYANSTTLDGRRFAEEFIRRRKLADKGLVPEASSNSNFLTGGGSESKSTGGWSEVAKKGPQKEEVREVFKVVAGKKKGKR